jgi:hypothetical protein
LCSQKIQRFFAQVRLSPLKRGDEIRPKSVWVIIPTIQRDPGDLRVRNADPFFDQRGLSKSRWGRYQRQAVFHSFTQLV